MSLALNKAPCCAREKSPYMLANLLILIFGSPYLHFWGWQVCVYTYIPCTEQKTFIGLRPKHVNR